MSALTKFWVRLVRGERGLTLLELLVVVSIMSILAALTGLAVTGASSTGRSGALTSDTNEVDKAVQNYTVDHPRSQYPTINGCLPGQTKSADGGCATGVDPGDYSSSDPATWEAILWDKAFTNRDGVVKVMVPDYLKKEPKHAREHNDTSSWTRTLTDPDGVVVSLSVPDHTGSQDDSVSTLVPVWVLDKEGEVHVTISAAAY
ncbi:MAG: prepilin-type N-terminal cleavage/methylation domain-containing protein [Chloroflexi bacterium]|nr:prepilin-type N-terminal cleavage/methylation domain-containing protein [Chloroflexota bacterium]